MGGFHDCLKSAYTTMEELEINYNLNRRQMTLNNKTIAEIAIP